MPARGSDELSQLGRAVNGMADALEHQATVDVLTGLHNLRHLSSSLEAMITSASLQHTPLSVLVCDLNDLKPVNDTYGHQAGDAVLKHVANAIAAFAAGESASCWRLGGDEFVLALPNTGESEGIIRAARLQKTIGELIVPLGDKIVRPSISVGVAAFPEDETSAGALLGIADRRMYEAKSRKVIERERRLASTTAA
jgi:diguanylate cyclase (GGDEF)-like protein